MEMYYESVEGLVNNLLAVSKPNNRHFIGEYLLHSKQFIPEMDHLVCGYLFFLLNAG